jgi:outer membrane protein
MRFVLSAVATCVLGLMSVAPAMAQAKTGVIDFQRAVVETAEFKAAYARLEAQYKPKQDALAKAQQELQDLETQIRASQGQLSQAGTAELQAKAMRKQTQVERLQMDLQEDFEADRDRALQLTSTRLTDVLKKVAEDKQLDMIVDTTALHFSKTTLDVTDAAIAAYNAAHPAK